MPTSWHRVCLWPALPARRHMSAAAATGVCRGSYRRHELWRAGVEQPVSLACAPASCRNRAAGLAKLIGEVFGLTRVTPYHCHAAALGGE